eukprot:4934969-Prymnesium_polylepis.2
MHGRVAERLLPRPTQQVSVKLAGGSCLDKRRDPLLCLGRRAPGQHPLGTAFGVQPGIEAQLEGEAARPRRFRVRDLRVNELRHSPRLAGEGRGAVVPFPVAEVRRLLRVRLRQHHPPAMPSQRRVDLLEEKPFAEIHAAPSRTAATRWWPAATCCGRSSLRKSEDLELSFTAC